MNGAKRQRAALHGWLALDKPEGITSTQAVGRVRRLTNAAKIGHGGTLDPLASGILPIAMGEATKTVSHVMDADKDYRFTIRFGQATETDDREGAVTAESAARPTDEAIRAALPKFLGQIEQRPPAFSALKIQGQRAYDLARAGEAVELASRRVRIDAFRLETRPDSDHASFFVTCGKGTYIRALARDLSIILGTCGHVSALRRLRVGRFDEASAFSLEKLEELCQKSAASEYLLPIETALDDIPALVLTGPQAERLRLGQAVRIAMPGQGSYMGQPLPPEGEIVAMANGRAVGFADHMDGEIRPRRLFNH